MHESAAAACLPTILSLSDVATHFKVTKNTIRNWIKADAFPRPLPLGGRPRWRLSDVQAFLDQRGA